MKNNKGFTLIELLAVITVLGMVMLLAVPTMMKAYYNTKNKIEKFNEEALLDSAKLYLVDLDSGAVDFYFPSTTVANNVTYYYYNKVDPYDLKVYLGESGLVVSVKDLVSKNYFKEEGCNYETEEGKTHCSVPETCTIKISLELNTFERDQVTYYTTKKYNAVLQNGCTKE